MNLPRLTPLNYPALMEAADRLPLRGRMACSKSQLLYLDLDDRYIHALNPFFKDPQIQIPDYFRAEKSGGAHISVKYSDEQGVVPQDILGQEHGFRLGKLVKAEFGPKIYYVILVQAPSLLEIRRAAGLPDLLHFKGYDIGFHITVGVGA